MRIKTARRWAASGALLNESPAIHCPRKGAPTTIGRSLDELVLIVDAVGRHERLGVCLDSCHLFVSGVDVTDPVQYEEYKKLSSAAMQATGAEVCIRGGQVEVLEGDWSPKRVVMLKFPTFAEAKAFYEAPEYLKAREAREGAAVMRMIAVEGL